MLFLKPGSYHNFCTSWTGRSSYEVEVELKKDLIAEQLKRQRLGKNHAVYEILTGSQENSI